MRITSFILSFVCASVLGAQARLQFSSDQVEQGRAQYAGACSACHGLSGGGGRGPSLVDGLSVRRATDAKLYGAIQKGVPGTEMPPFPFADNELWNLVAFVRSLSAPASEAEISGDAKAGSDLYHGAGKCSGCHKIRGSGGVLGPDLTNIGAERRLDRLRESLLEPNVEIAVGYDAVRLVAANGTSIRAIAKNRTNHSAQILDEQGKLHLLRRGDLAKIEAVDRSWMPADFGERFKEEQINDLLAFLAQQTIRPVEGDR